MIRLRRLRGVVLAGTEAFRTFADLKVGCDACSARLKELHSVEEQPS